MEPNSGETGSQFSKSEASASPEISRKWAHLAYKIYERMIHSSEVSFFLSTPQLISSLGFILGVCNMEETQGLINEFDGGEDNTEIDFLIDQTLKFVHKWSAELRSLLGPGQYHRARRVYCHPKYVNPHNENTFQFFRLFRAEEKIFDGFGEVRKWASRSLKVDFSPSQKMLIMWPCDFTTMKKQNLKDELSTKTGKKDSNNEASLKKEGGLKKVIPTMSSTNNLIDAPRKDPSDTDKKAPIVTWMSHAIVEMPDEFFDGDCVYTWNQQEYLRIHESPVFDIKTVQGKFEFNALMVPTQNNQLHLVIFYGFDAKLCSLNALRSLVSNYSNPRGPSILRHKQNKDLTKKRTIYFPHWKYSDFPASRIAQHMVATMDLHAIFVAGGFGDLAIADAVPSATGDPKKISHFQNYGLLSFRNCPKNKKVSNGENEPLLRRSSFKILSKKKKPAKPKVEKIRRVPLHEVNAEEVEFINYPICVVLWDKNRDLPAFMGKVTGKSLELEANGAKIQDATSKGKKKKFWCC